MTNISVENLSVPEEKPQSQPPEWRRYFSFSTDHKVIGIQYLVTSFIFFDRRVSGNDRAGGIDYARVRFGLATVI